MDDFHYFLLSGYLGSKKAWFLLSGRICCPNVLLSCKQTMSHCAIYHKNKSSTQSHLGLLQSLLVAKGKLVSWSIDLIMDLPISNGNNAFFIYFDRLTKYYSLIPCFVGEGALQASSVAQLFFDNVVRLFSVPAEVIQIGTLGSLLPSGRSYGLCWGPSC